LPPFLQFGLGIPGKELTRTGVHTVPEQICQRRHNGNRETRRFTNPDDSGKQLWRADGIATMIYSILDEFTFQFNRRTSRYR